MKSLKRTLCLVLALVMVLGLFGIASATSFTDDNSIQYKEAVDVMTGIGAINGYNDGSFGPKGTITRAEAAKLVAYAVLGKATADKLTGVSSSFTDVDAAAYSWAIPSIEYLVKEGVINGRGDGTFDPAGQITGYEVGKMLLCSLGYGAKGEYVGSQWALNVAIDGAKLGDGTVVNPADPTTPDSTGRLAVFSGRAADAAALSNPATREEVALYCFNTIQKQQVEYISTLDLYATTSALGNGLGSIAENVYPTLTRDGDATDAYGRPAVEWFYGTATICTAAETPILTYTTGVTVKKLKLDVTNAGYELVVDDDGSDSSGPVPEIITNNGTADAAPETTLADTETIGGNGIVVEVFGDKATNEVKKVVITETEFKAVDKITEDDPATTTVDERAIKIDDYKAVAGKTEGFDAVYSVVKALLDAGKDAAVLVVPDMGSDEGVALAVSIPASAEVKVESVNKVPSDPAGYPTRYDKLKSFTADGKIYEPAAKATAYVVGVPDANDNNAIKNCIAKDTKYTVYMDKYGYVIYADESSSDLSLGIAIEAGYGNDGFGNTEKVKFIGLDGKEFILPVEKDVVNTSADPIDFDGSGPIAANTIVSYTASEDEEGRFAVANPDDTTSASKTLTIVKGKVEMALTDNGTKNANDDTIFVVQTLDKTVTPHKATYTVYTGINNVPSLTAAGFSVYVPTGKSFASVVFAADANFTDVGTTDLAFIAVDSTVKTEGEITYFDGALITGSGYTNIQQVKVKDTAAATIAGAVAQNKAPIVKSYTLKDGVITEVVMFTDTSEVEVGGGKGTERVSANVINLGGTNHTFTSDCVVWEIDASKTVVTQKFVPKTVNQIGKSGTDNVYYVQDAITKTVSAIYIVKSDVPAITASVANTSATSVKLAKSSGSTVDSLAVATGKITIDADETLSNGETATLAYAWKRDNTPLNSVTSNELTLDYDTMGTPTIAGTATFTCTVTATYDTNKTVTKTLTISIAIQAAE